MLVTDCEEPGPDEGPEEGYRWSMYFDGASNTLGNGIGTIIISPEGCHTPFTARSCFNCTNNMAEYEACILGLRAAINMPLIPYFFSNMILCSMLSKDHHASSPSSLPRAQKPQSDGHHMNSIMHAGQLMHTQPQKVKWAWDCSGPNCSINLPNWV